MEKSNGFFPNLPLKERVLEIMKSTKDFGGPQSVRDLQDNLKITNGSSRSVLVRLYKSGQIERIGKGTYRIRGDLRKHNKSKPHI